MNNDCQHVQDWLLECIDLRREAARPADVALHLASCADCRRMARQLIALEDAWRARPTPAAAETAKAAFFAELPQPGSRVAAPGDLLSRRNWIRRGAVAAAATVVAGTGLWMLLAPPEAQADDELLDRLFDWNLRLAGADSPQERDQLYADQAARLRLAVKVARLTPQHVALAQSYLDNGTWLAAHQDPIFAADRFDGLAQRLFDMARLAGEEGNHKRMNRLLRQYCRIVESGIGPNLDRAEAVGSLDFEHQKYLERLILQDQKRLRQLAALLDRAPDASRSDIRRALKVQQKHPKKPAHGKRAPAG